MAIPFPRKKYEDLGKIGEGGMGAVHKARHIVLDKIVAIKLLPASLAHEPDLVARFRREARIMADLAHNNIVKVHDFEQEEDLYYLVEDFIDGQDLRRHLRDRGPLPIVEALEIGRQIASALAYLHGRGVVHRDIKPNNVLIERGPTLRAVLTDFGIAKVEDSEATVTGMYLGSPKYSAPEQAGYGRRGNKRARIDARTDIFAFGLVLYEMCEGRQFFEAQEPYEVIGRLVYDKEPLVPEFTQPVPDAVVALLTRAVQREPEARYQSMNELMRDLEACLRTLGGDERTIVAPPAAQVPVQASDDEIDNQIQALRAEQQRRLALAAQEQARAARAAAASVHAPELAEALFQEAALREQEGSAALQGSVFTQARELLERAAEAFRKAQTEAEARAAAREAEEARGAAHAARAEAELSRAPAAARTLYGRAQALEREADHDWERAAYADAGRRFREAQALYGEAAGAADRETLRQGVESARAALEAVRTAASDADTSDIAATLWTTARQEEVRAEAALKADQLAEAGELFRSAAAAYERAAAEGRRRQARQRAVDAQECARRGAAAAQQAAAPQSAAEAYDEAMRALRAADDALSAEAFDEAAAGFARADTLFRNAASQAEALAAKREAEQARDAVHVARARADAEQAPDEARTLYGRANGMEGEADHAWERGAYADAIRQYREAESLYEQAGSTAQRRALREALNRTRNALEAARATARDAGAADLATATWAAAREHAASADAALTRGDLDDANRLFTAAVETYERAAREAHDRGREQGARTARADAQRWEEAARQAGAGRAVADAYQEAARTLEAANRALAAGTFDEAAASFGRAARLFEDAAARAAAADRAQATEVTPDFGTVVVAAEPDATESRLRDATARSNDDTVLGASGEGATEVLHAPQRPAPETGPTIAWDLEADIVVPDREDATEAGTLTERPRLDEDRTTKQQRPFPEDAGRPGSKPMKAPPPPPPFGRGAPEGATSHARPGGAATALATAPAETVRLPRGFLDEVEPAERRDDLGEQRGRGATKPLRQAPRRLPLWIGSGVAVALAVAAIVTIGPKDLLDFWAGKPRQEAARRATTPPPSIVERPAEAPTPAPEPMRWGEVSPPAAAAEVAEGEILTFAAAVSDPQRFRDARYTWTLDGEQQASGPTWEYQPAFVIATPQKPGEKTVRVVASSGNESEIDRTWRVVVRNTNRPPIIESATPAASVVELPAGGRLAFTILAGDPDLSEGDSLTYTWVRNGNVVSSERSWTLSNASEKDSEVGVTVKDAADASAGSRTWKVALKTAPENDPPSIVHRSPAGEQITIDRGQSVTFSVKATDPNPGDRLAYAWFLNDREVSTRSTWTFPSDPELSTSRSYDVAVAVTDSRGLKAKRAGWTVRLRVPEPAPAPPPPSTLSKTDVEGWLERYERAWNQKDFGTLARMGIVKTADVEKLEKAMKPYRRFAVSNVRIDLDAGGQQATVSFDRQDTDDYGKVLTSQHLYRLEKGQAGALTTTKLTRRAG
jgi:hypothetical protein